MASTLQTWYQKIYDQPPSKGFVRHVAYQVAGVLAFCVYIAVEVLVLDAIRPVGHVAMFALEFVFAVLFWWCSAYFLLYGKLGWLEMLPAGIATGICITGLGVFSALLFSDQISSGEKSYGPAGVVMVIASYLIGFGVCLHLGAVFGRIWNDRQRRATTEESSP
jgi:membrane protein